MNLLKAVFLALLCVAVSGFGSNAVAAGGGAVLTDPGAMAGKHFHPKGKLPSETTIALKKKQLARLPFEDERDFAEAKRGFIAAPSYNQIMAEAGNVAWDMAATSGCCRAGTSTASIPRCSARPY